MTHDPFETLMRDAAHSYNVPPPAPLDEIWDAVQRELAAAPRDGHAVDRTGRLRSWSTNAWLRTAAVLLIGISAGRASIWLLPGSSAGPSATPYEATGEVVGWHIEDQWLSEQYLGQTAALLIALPTELGAERADSTFGARADELLLQTRLLLDSPAATDPVLHGLLEDLELVLVQVVRLQTDRDPFKIDLLRQALEQHELMPRLQNAVIQHFGD